MSMSIANFTSEKSSRRVRFSLPEAKLIFPTDKKTLHGTSKYVNGTLINVISTVHPTGVDGSRSGAANRATSKSSEGLLLNIRPTNTATNNSCGTRGELKPNSSALSLGYRRRKSKPLTRQSFSGLPTIDRKSSSLDDSDLDHFGSGKAIFSNLTKYKSSEDLRDPSTFKIKSLVKLPDTPQTLRKTTSNLLKVPDLTRKYFHESTKEHFQFSLMYLFVAPSSQSGSENCHRMKNDSALCYREERLKNSQLDANGNLEQFFDFIEKWRNNRFSGNKRIDDIFR